MIIGDKQLTRGRNTTSATDKRQHPLPRARHRATPVTQKNGQHPL